MPRPSTPSTRTAVSRKAAMLGHLLLEIEVQAAGRGYLLAAVLAAARRAVRRLSRRRHQRKRDLADPHAGIQRNRQISQIADLQGEMTFETRVDESGGTVDHDAESAQRTAAFEAGDQIVGHAHPFDGVAKDEPVRMKEHRLLWADFDQ